MSTWDAKSADEKATEMGAEHGSKDAKAYVAMTLDSYGAGETPRGQRALGAAQMYLRTALRADGLRDSLWPTPDLSNATYAAAYATAVEETIQAALR